MDAPAILVNLASKIELSSSSEINSANDEMIRGLLAVESLLRTSLLKPEVYKKILGSQLTILSSNRNENISSAVVIKSKKILLIIEGLIKHYSE